LFENKRMSREVLEKVRMERMEELEKKNAEDLDEFIDDLPEEE
jgi:hypothetical protein